MLPKHIMERIEFDTNGGCWLWAGAMLQDRYPYHSSRHSSHRLVRRAVWSAVNSKCPPSGLAVSAACGVSACVNPDHLAPTPRSQTAQTRTNAARQSLKHGTLQQRIADNIRTDEATGCHVWIGRLNSGGYGEISVNNRNRRAHVVAYTLTRGEVPDGLELDHLCRNRRCCNPDHLEAVTHRENMLRGLGVGSENARKTHCAKGHEFSPRNTYWRKGGGRGCRLCGAAASRAYLARRTA